jgi:hypothetical protein
MGHYGFLKIISHGAIYLHKIVAITEGLEKFPVKHAEGS